MMFGTALYHAFLLAVVFGKVLFFNVNTLYQDAVATQQCIDFADCSDKKKI